MRRRKTLFGLQSHPRWGHIPEVWINQTPLCYIIGYNILRYQALPWHISYQETVCFLGGGALYSAFSTYPTDHIRDPGHGNIGPDALGSGFSRCERSPRRGHSGGMTPH